MEFVVLVIVIVAVVLPIRRRKKERERFNKLSEKEKQSILKEDQIKKQQADELITAILPIIKNGK